MLATGWLVGCAMVGEPQPAYRDVLVYGRSQPEAVASTVPVIGGELVLNNRTSQPIAARVALAAEPLLGLPAFDRTLTLAPGENAVAFTMLAKVHFDQVVLNGQLWLGLTDADATPDRDLFIAVRGPDLADFAAANVQRLDAPATIVAVHAPRSEARGAALLRECEREQQSGDVVLAAAGRSDYTVVLQPMRAATEDTTPDNLDAWLAGPLTADERHLGEAIGDLVRIVALQSGATMPVAAHQPTEASRVIDIALIDAPADWPHDDAYRLVVTRAGDIRIRAATLAGLRHGVHGLLSEHLSTFWFQPGELGEEVRIPDDRTVRLSVTDELRAPAFYSATGMSWGHAPRWDRRNRTRILEGRMSFGHAWHSLISPREYPYDEHPDMWARDRDGNVMVRDLAWTFTQFCSTSPEVIEIVARKINAHFDAHPDAIVASIDPNDLAPLCLCDRCLALDRHYGIDEQGGQHMADRLLHFSKQIHDRLKPEHRDKYLGILAYAAQTNLPKTARPHDHHATIVCQFPPLFDHSRPFTDPTSPWARRFHEIVQGWAGMTPHTGFYDYFGHYNYFGPWGVVQKLREDLPAFREAGGTFLVVEAQPNFAMQGLNHYIAAQLLWRPNADVDLLLEQFYAYYYGPAAGPMRRFWRTAERHFALQRPGIDTHLRVAAEPAFWAELDNRLTAAEAAVANDAVAKRYRDRIAFHRDGLTFADLMYQLDYRYVPLRAPVEDVDASLAFLREHRATFEFLRAKYPGGEAYWPPLVAPYFHRPIDKMISELEALKADPSRSREIGEALDSIGG
jgi:hypothetical protein